MSGLLEDKDKNEVFVPSAVLDEALEAINKVVPAKSKYSYEKQYTNFCEWRKRNHAKDRGSLLVVQILDTKTHKPRTFIIVNGSNTVPAIDVFRKYRWSEKISHKRLFINYKNKKCTVQPVRVSTFSEIPENLEIF